MGNINSKCYRFIKEEKVKWKSEETKSKANENSKSEDNKKKKIAQAITYKLYEDKGGKEKGLT